MFDDPRYREGILLFQEEEWFECHEVLEAIWRATPKGAERELLQGLIQLAVSLEHWRRHNPRGAAGQWAKAQGHLAGLPAAFGGIDLAGLIAEFGAVWASVSLDDAVRAQAAGAPWAEPARVWPAPRWL